MSFSTVFPLELVEFERQIILCELKSPTSIKGLDRWIIEYGEVFIDITNGIVSVEALCNVDSAAEVL